MIADNLLSEFDDALKKIGTEYGWHEMIGLLYTTLETVRYNYLLTTTDIHTLVKRERDELRARLAELEDQA
jgi:hypothetical protein